MKTPLKILAKNKRWRLRHPEQNKSIARKYYLSNSEKIKARVREYKKQNKITVNASNRNWRAKNIEKAKAFRKKWTDKFPAKLRSYCAKRRALRAEAILGDQRKVDKIYARARELGQWFDVVVDHIIPLAKGGAHSFDNLQIIYAVENSQKGSRLDYKPKIIFK